MLVLVAAVLLPLVQRSTNCGGNTAALNACRSVVGAFDMVALDRGDNKPFSIADLNEREREKFSHPVGINWLAGRILLVTTDPVVITEARPKRIIAVCEEPYDNVPRRWLGKSPMAHAVAYSDGTVGLISVPDFHRLDLSRFVDVATIPQARAEPSHPVTPSQPVRSESPTA
jgi:hypothetical protein